MKLPLTNLQEVLYTLIKQGYVSIFDFPYLGSFRSRVSNLRLDYGIQLETTMVKRNNKFGNHYLYAVHRLVNKEQAKELYKKLTVNN